MSYSFSFDDTTPVVNIMSEYLCWFILWAGIKVYSYYSKKKSNHGLRDGHGDDGPITLAFVISISSVCASITDINWILPFLTPAVYFVTRSNGVEQYLLPKSFQAGRSDYSPDYEYYLVFYILIAIATSLLFLPSSMTLGTLAIGLIFLLSQTAIFSRLNSLINNHNQYHSITNPLINGPLKSLEKTCRWAMFFIFLAANVIVQNSPPGGLSYFSMFVSSILKAFLWTAVLFLCNEGHACTLTLMTTFGLSTIYIPVVTSPILAILSCLCALLILCQIISSLRRHYPIRRVVTLLALFPILTLLFRLGLSDTGYLPGIFTGLKDWLNAETSCRTNEIISKNMTEIARGVLDEPSRLVAEFGPREDLESWKHFFMRLLSQPQPCTISTPEVFEL